MAINYDELGKRISYFRARKGFSQETLGERIGVNNKHISNIEIGKSRPSLDSLVEIANALGISADDLLVDSLEHSVSTADSDLHRLLLECNEMEETILTRTVTLDSLRKNKNITLATLESLCRILDCTPNDVVRFIDEPEPGSNSERV